MNNKIKQICWTVATVIIAIIDILVIVGGVKLKDDDLIVAGVICGILFIPLFVWGTVSQFIKDRRATKNANLQYTIAANDKRLMDKYQSIKEEDYNEVGFVSFVEEGIKFSAKAKYGCVKNFNDKQGYHLAFNIQGKKLVDKPADYEDVADFESVLFNIELGYFDGFLLSTPENENGIIVQSTNLEGKTIQIAQYKGYIASISTAETDDIDVGEITFVKWSNEEKIIKFKLIVGSGLCDVVVGTVKLTEEKYKK